MLAFAQLLLIFLLYPGETDSAKQQKKSLTKMPSTTRSGMLEAKRSAGATTSTLQLSPSRTSKLTDRSNVDLKSSSSKHRFVFKEAAVACNSDFAAQVAIDILRQGGSVADAAIGTLLAEGLANPQSLGLGGGFVLTYYDAKNNLVSSLNARECAPSLATENMFSKGNYEPGVTVAVPGEVKGYWELHQKYGVMEWSKIFEPIIKASRQGIKVTGYTNTIFKLMKKSIKSSPTLKQIFINPDTDDVYNEGDIIKRVKLADTLEMMAKFGADVLYNGKLTKTFVQDIKQKGGIITAADMNNYRARWCDSTRVRMGNDTALYSMPLPGGGLVVSLIMDVMSKLARTADDVQNWFRFVETWKYAFGYKYHFEGPVVTDEEQMAQRYEAQMGARVSELVSVVKTTSDDVKHYTDAYGSAYYGGGTCHVCILAANGDAVSATSSINSAFGALFRSPTTGIILNNHMMDFNVPEYDADVIPTNKIYPYKQPMSSMAPSMLLDEKKKKVVMLIGAAGGSKIITSITQVLVDYLLKKIPIAQALQNKRVHHSLIPMKLRYEEGFSPHIIDGLAALGHTLKVIPLRSGEQMLPASSSIAVIVVGESGGRQTIEAYGDPRRRGSAAGY